MSVTSYEILSAATPDALQSLVTAAITAGWQPNPNGQLLVAEISGIPTYSREMIKGVVDFNNLASASAAVANGDTVAVHNSAGGDSHNATAEVSSNSLTDVKFAATIAMVDNSDTVVVKNSAGTTVTGTHTAEVAVGVLTDVKLAATVAPVLNGGTLTGVTPSGTYSTTVTFTVASGVITAIALS